MTLPCDAAGCSKHSKLASVAQKKSCSLNSKFDTEGAIRHAMGAEISNPSNIDTIQAADTLASAFNCGLPR
jgi:hypothetical protein